MAEQATARQLSIDPGSFAQRADLALLDDAGQSRTMGEKGRALVIDQYGWATIARRMAALYSSIGGGRRETGS